MLDDHSRLQSDASKVQSFRWQLSDFLTLLPAFAFTVVDVVNPSQHWPKFGRRHATYGARLQLGSETWKRS